MMTVFVVLMIVYWTGVIAAWWCIASDYSLYDDLSPEIIPLSTQSRINSEVATEMCWFIWLAV